MRSVPFRTVCATKMTRFGARRCRPSARLASRRGPPSRLWRRLRRTTKNWGFGEQPAQLLRRSRRAGTISKPTFGVPPELTRGSALQLAFQLQLGVAVRGDLVLQRRLIDQRIAWRDNHAWLFRALLDHPLLDLLRGLEVRGRRELLGVLDGHLV